jgi:hypothetical protein
MYRVIPSGAICDKCLAFGCIFDGIYKHRYPIQVEDCIVLAEAQGLLAHVGLMKTKEKNN